MPTNVAYVDYEAEGESPANDRHIAAVVTELEESGLTPVSLEAFNSLSAYTVFDTDAFFVGFANFAFPPSPEVVTETEGGLPGRPRSTC